jgi:hypothetical protein
MKVPKWCRRKLWYPNLITARKRGAEIWVKKDRRLWPYHCDFCKGWHLTSKSPDEQLKSGYCVKLK